MPRFYSTGNIRTKLCGQKIKDEQLQEIQKHVIGLFNTVSLSFEGNPDLEDGLSDFLIGHEGIFERIDEKRILRDDEPARSVISGRAIYPEGGDARIMLDAVVSHPIRVLSHPT